MKLSELKEGLVINLTKDNYLTIKSVSEDCVKSSFTMKNFNYTADTESMTVDEFIGKMNEYGISVDNDIAKAR